MLGEFRLGAWSRKWQPCYLHYPVVAAVAKHVATLLATVVAMQ